MLTVSCTCTKPAKTSSTRRAALLWSAGAAIGTYCADPRAARAALVQFPSSSFHNRYILVRLPPCCAVLNTQRHSCYLPQQPRHALTAPTRVTPPPKKNRTQIRAGESNAEDQDTAFTNPVWKTSMMAGLSDRGKRQVRAQSDSLQLGETVHVLLFTGVGVGMLEAAPLQLQSACTTPPHPRHQPTTRSFVKSCRSSSP